MEHFVIIVNCWNPLTIITKSSILDVAAVLDPPLHYINGAESLNFFIKGTVSKSKRVSKVYQQFDVDIVSPVCNFIKNENPAQMSMFSCELC